MVPVIDIGRFPTFSTSEAGLRSFFHDVQEPIVEKRRQLIRELSSGRSVGCSALNDVKPDAYYSGAARPLIHQPHQS